MVFLNDKASEGARDPFRLAGRIGKQVQNLRGTAAVMAEPGSNCMSLHYMRGKTGVQTKMPEPEDLPLDVYCR